ncbi:MAG: hypothetical protein IJ458_02775 [Clostridia bacterium]|nr:hypothetical protein [Clostridia bacterium]
MKNKTKKPNLGNYLKKYKIAIIIYILIMILASTCSIFITITSANVIEFITLSKFSKAIVLGFIFLGLCVLQRVFWCVANIMYFTYSNRIMSDLNFDLAKQSFKLNSKTYSDHDTGTFVTRIVSDPEQVVSKCADIVDIITELITAIVMLVYITTLNSWIALIFVGILIVGMIIERFRVKLRRKNKIAVKKI